MAELLSPMIWKLGEASLALEAQKKRSEYPLGEKKKREKRREKTEKRKKVAVQHTYALTWM